MGVLGGWTPQVRGLPRFFARNTEAGLSRWTGLCLVRWIERYGGSLESKGWMDSWFLQ